ncbi:uncharacterized protein LOC129730466 [Wyeomyia smithii]|uniref:uncharacterized protein LOC129730466 n=1 Tax=Wyeomyia smithii TaxID=174621 RepID=UPI002467E9B5|nr:uncharacterized protein LOC129730466 [Wyeomyia smithii]XP_055545784.1 uncharacterized protein LOC129730466 [Wyeomyia smithii]
MTQFYQFTILFVSICAVYNIEAVKHYQIDKYKLCDGLTNSAVKFSNVKIVGKKQAIVISGNMEALRNVQPPLTFIISVNRCNLDQTGCAHFNTITFDDFCPMYNENQLVKAHLGFITPPMDCPIQIGTYTANEGVLDMKVFDGFAIGNAHWQSEMKIIDGANETALCIHSKVTVNEKN